MRESTVPTVTVIISHSGITQASVHLHPRSPWPPIWHVRVICAVFLSFDLMNVVKATTKFILMHTTVFRKMKLSFRDFALPHRTAWPTDVLGPSKEPLDIRPNSDILGMSIKCAKRLIYEYFCRLNLWPTWMSLGWPKNSCHILSIKKIACNYLVKVIKVKVIGNNYLKLDFISYIYPFH